MFALHIAGGVTLVVMGALFLVLPVLGIVLIGAGAYLFYTGLCERRVASSKA